MKYPLYLLIVTILIVTRLAATAQSESEKLDLPGDNLNLYAVMKLFQDSKSLEGFEKALNSGNCEINNLDLDGDRRVDYIRVTDSFNNNIHTITLDIAVNENEDQDVAVFFVEKRTNGQILVELMGDEDLYGKDYFIEPADQTFRETPKTGYGTENAAKAPKFAAPNMVAAWPIIKFITAPNYVIWRSPWRWGNNPVYWKPLSPQYWHYYYAYNYHLRSYYNANYRRCPYFRNPTWFSHYYGGNFRSRSVTVRTRLGRGDYRLTYAKPTSAAEGSAFFAKQNPNLTASRERPPSFDSKGKPVAPRVAPTVEPEKKSTPSRKPSTKRKKIKASNSSKTKTSKAKPTQKSSRNNH